MMISTNLAIGGLVMLAVAGAAYALLYPLVSGERRVAKRHKAVLGAAEQRVDRVRGGGREANRRDAVAQSLKEIEQRQKDRTRISLEGRIAQAGLDWTKGRFLLVSAAFGLVVALLVFVLSGNPIFAASAAFVAGLGIPRWVLSFRRKRRMNRYLDELPNAIDVIVRGIRSGLPINDCLRIVAAEAREPVRSEFRYVVDQQTLGIPLPEAVAKLYERVPVPESNFFAIVLGIQAKAGGNLSEALGNLSRVLRERKKMKAKIAAMSMEAKSSAGIIGALPFVVGTLTYLSSPSYIEMLWTTGTGQIALMGSGLWMTIGILVMRKMINFDF